MSVDCSSGTAANSALYRQQGNWDFKRRGEDESLTPVRQKVLVVESFIETVS